jgi:hypothetical protein
VTSPEKYHWYDDRAAALRSPASVFGGGWVYGTGEDGDLVLEDGDVLGPGNYHNVTIVGGAVVGTESMDARVPLICCTGVFTNNGTLNLSGADATPWPSEDFDLNASLTTSDAPSAALAVPFPGGTGGSGGAGENAPGQAPDPALKGVLRALAWQKPANGGSLRRYTDGGAGAGDGNGELGNGNAGGPGGKGGNLVVVAARRIVFGPDALVDIKGGDGLDGGDDGTGVPGHGNCGGGGGGGGGGGLLVITDEVTGECVTVGSGGSPGSGCGTGEDGEPGTDGAAIIYLSA